LEDDSEEVDVAFAVGSKAAICSAGLDETELFIISDRPLGEPQVFGDIAYIVSFIVIIHVSFIYNIDVNVKD
jgi:hypothetical protein